jgi:hypothetical protein
LGEPEFLHLLFSSRNDGARACRRVMPQARTSN